MKVERMVSSGQISRQPRMRARVCSCAAGVHAPQHVRAGVLKRHVEIGQHLAVRHQRDDLVDVRVGIDVVQPHPDAELAERASEIEEFRPQLAALPLARGIPDVDAVGRGILGDDQQLLHPGGDQPLGFAQNVGGRARDQVAAQPRDDAEGAAVVAAFGNLQIGVVAGVSLMPSGGTGRGTGRAAAAPLDAPPRPRSRIAAGR